MWKSLLLLRLAAIAAFHSCQWSSFSIHLGGGMIRSFGVSLMLMVMTGRGSLPRYGPRDIDASEATSALVIMRLINEVLHVDGLM